MEESGRPDGRRDRKKGEAAEMSDLEEKNARTPVGLELHEMDAIIDDNITITDPKLRDAVYAVVIDTMYTVLDKNGLLPEGADDMELLEENARLRDLVSRARYHLYLLADDDDTEIMGLVEEMTAVLGEDNGRPA